MVATSRTRTPWYKRYADLRREVDSLKQEYIDRCKHLNADPNEVLAEVRKEIIVRAVHESNWQEGVHLSMGRTRELADAVFEQMDSIRGPHLDMAQLLDIHRRDVLALKRRGGSPDDVAALNLSRAHLALAMVGDELFTRQMTSLVVALKGFGKVEEELAKQNIEQDKLKTIRHGLEVVRGLEESSGPIYGPLTEGVQCEGGLIKALSNVEFDHLLKPFRLEYVHFFHRLVMMGILPPKKLGEFRRLPVHVGDPDVFFPPPSVLQELIQEFCAGFPPIVPQPKYDVILKSATVSHRFVRIHPYSDGNGRVSRILMNLILWRHYPPVYLKADSEGRHRYAYALRRANDGNHEPMAALIAASLIAVYRKMIAAISLS